jgi:beta-lactamase regulating signal transducer with metallopeptidase domain
VNHFVNEFSGQWADAMWRATLQGALMTLVVWAARKAWKKMPPSLCCFLWCFVCVKMLICLVPLSLNLPVLPPPSAPVLAPVVTTSFVDSSSLPSSATLVESAPLRIVEGPTAFAYLMFVWALVGAVRIGATARTLMRIGRMRKAAVRFPDFRLAMKIAREVGLALTPEVRLTQTSIGTMTIGAWRPAVLVSQETLARCSEEEVRVLLTHEFLHVRRRDGWLGLIPQLTQTIFFFSPFVWLACREFDLERESACDEDTLAVTGSPIDSYGRLIISLAQPSLPLPLSASGISSHFRNLQRRINMIGSNGKQPTKSRSNRRAWLVALLGLGSILPWSLVESQTPQHPPALPSRPVVVPKRIQRKVGNRLAPAPPAQTPIPNAPTSPPAVAGRSRRSHVAPARLATPREAPSRPPLALSAPEAAPMAVQGRRAPASRRTNVIHLRRTRAAQIAKILKSLMTPTQLRIAVDDPTNSLVLNGSEEDLAKATTAVSLLDQKLDPAPKLRQVRTIQLQNGSADRVANLLRSTMGSVNLSVNVDPAGNALVLSGDEETVAKAAAEISLLDSTESPQLDRARQLVVFHLKKIKAIEARAKVQEKFKSLVDRYLSISTDDHSNSMVISAKPATIDDVVAYLKVIDR